MNPAPRPPTRVRNTGRPGNPPACVLALALLLGAPAADAAGRGRYGGTARVALHGQVTDSADPLVLDTPQEAALLALTTRGLCRLEPDGRITPMLAQSFIRETDTRLQITLRPGLTAASGGPLTAREVAQSLTRAAQAQTHSPYRALLYPWRGEGRHVQPFGAGRLGIGLSFPWPDLERTLCHPALALPEPSGRTVRPGAGPYLPARALGVWVANGAWVGGRPYVDRLAVTSGDAQSSRRLLQLAEAEVGLGAQVAPYEPAPPPPALFATWLLFRPERTGEALRGVVERVVDRADLTRFFVHPPAVPMSSLLPPALMPQAPAAPQPARPGARPPGRELTLLYDLGLPDQKGVAERIQVKLHDAGYKVALRGVSRSELRARWANGSFDLMLHALLLPPVPSPALALVLDLAGRRDLLAKELPPLGAVTEDRARDAAARDRARALQGELALVPLYAQGVRWVTHPRVANPQSDGHGVPQLDDLFFLAPSGGP